ncbi:putative Calpain family cysteine protease [Trypanosoma vivax]|nr:putative Calpain family cysteine protease [Trypanosoma vivax]
MVDGRVLFVRSPTGHWWPLLLEKAYAKFYTLYRNLEGCTLREIFHDLTGKPVLNIPMETKLAKAVMCDVDEASFWLELDEDLRECACTAVAQRGFEESHGLLEGQAYGILGVVAMGDCADASTSGLLVKLHNPLVEMEYTGPMNAKDSRWTAELRTVLDPDQCNTIYVPVDVFREAFTGIDKALLRGLVQPAWHFNSEWGDGTNGGNPTLVTWRENPLYVVRNTSDNPIQITAMIGQPDQRRMLHLLPRQSMNYLQCGLCMARNTTSNPIPTYLVTSNNHRLVHKGLFLSFVKWLIE